MDESGEASTGRVGLLTLLGRGVVRVVLSLLWCLRTRAYTALARVRSAALPVAETNRAARLGKSVATESTSTPLTSARRCADWVVYRAGLRQRAGSKSRTVTGNQEPWRPSSSTRASTAAPNRRGVGGPDGVLLDLLEEEWFCLHLHLLALDGGIPLLGGDAEELALGKHGNQHHRRGGEDWPPAAGKHRRACGFLEGKTGDDVAE
jgi:hypothetical protein